MPMVMDVERDGLFKWQNDIYRVVQTTSSSDIPVRVRRIAFWMNGQYNFADGKTGEENFNPLCEVQVNWPDLADM